MSAAWFEEQPSKSYQSRLETMVDREIDSLAESSRHGFFSDLVASWRGAALTAGWASGMAAIAAVWLVSRQRSESTQEVQLADLEVDLDLRKVSVEDFSIIADLELYDDLELLESLSDDDLGQGESDS